MDAKRLLSALRAQAVEREARWRLLSRWICPWRGIFPDDDLAISRSRDESEFTQAASMALLRAASGMTAGMTPRSIAWFRPEFIEPSLMELDGAREWLNLLERRIQDVLNRGGFYQAIHNFNMDLLWAGCAMLYSEKGEDSVLRFETIQPGSFFAALDRDRRLEAVGRLLIMTPQAMADEFGKNKLSRATASKLRTDPWRPMRVWQLVRRDAAGAFPVRSWYWEDGASGFLRESGFHEMPYFFSVWHEGASVYGSGPGDDCLWDAMQMDQLESRKLEGVSKLISPPLLAPSAYKDLLDLEPDGISFVPNVELIRPVLDLSPYAAAMPHIQQEIATVRKRLEDGLMASIFASMPLESRPRDMSATEYLERRRENLQLLGPVMSAYEPNVLIPLLYRTASALNRAKLLPPLPEALQNLPVMMKMDFISPAANSLSQSGVETTRALVSDALMLAQAAGPQILDKLDCDQVIDELAADLGAPGSIIRPDEEVAQIREQRAQAQMAQMQAQEESAVAYAGPASMPAPQNPGEPLAMPPSMQEDQPDVASLIAQLDGMGGPVE